MDRQDDIYRIIGKLESAIDLMQKTSSSCKSDRKKDIEKIHTLLDNLKEELDEHKKNDKKQARIETKKIYIGWGLGFIAIGICIYLAWENEELMGVIKKLLDFIF